jgi:hypothetical protein
VYQKQCFGTVLLEDIPKNYKLYQIVVVLTADSLLLTAHTMERVELAKI